MTITALLDDAELSIDRAHQAYLDLAGRGENTVNTMRAQPPLARGLDGLHTVATRVDQRLQDIADELHDSSEELLGWVSMGISAAGRWLVRPTPRRTRTLLHSVSHRPTPGDFTPDDLTPEDFTPDGPTPSPITSLHDRVIIERATGVLAQHGGVGMDTAFDRMCNRARNDRPRVVALARQIVAGDVDLDTLLPTPTTATCAPPPAPPTRPGCAVTGGGV